MSIFWTVFWIALLIIPALWLAAFVWQLIIYLVVLVVSIPIVTIQWLVSKLKGE